VLGLDSRATGNGGGFGMLGGDEDITLVGGAFGGGELKTCIGLSTDCTTCGLSVALVASAVTLTAFSPDVLCLRRTLKMVNAAANRATKATNLPLLVLKKLRKSRGFIDVLQVKGWELR
jgi:hypothetical protein